MQQSFKFVSGNHATIHCEFHSIETIVKDHIAIMQGIVPLIVKAAR